VAERLGQAGMTVHIVEKGADIGGHVADMGCKATDVCLRCSVCVAQEIVRSVKAARHAAIYTNTELIAVHEGGNGSRFTAVLRSGNQQSDSTGGKKPRCPIYKTEGSAGISEGIERTIEVDAIVIATGYEPYDPRQNSSFGYGRIPNVITGLDAERQIADSHRISRITDGKLPERMAFIQCVGSRTEEIFRRPEDTDYCSTVCCAYALRMAALMKHQAGDTQITVFYMDIQNFGKGFTAFYNDCKRNMRFVRSRPYELTAGADGSVRVRYTPESGGVCEEEFDMVVLATGIRPSADNRELADRVGIAVDGQGFLGLKGPSALPEVQRQGIYVAGACESPKDIPCSIAQARAVSAAVLSSL